ncbi:MAG: hypothetical protein ABS28_10545 [Cryomorphaceae bacterium BACL22 MAG-120619-bin32]|nr:MAG: hypothetical protein ABS28_10545 [Cryomorphaceae bacterium BACL22 MAG-120619-bin32]
MACTENDLRDVSFVNDITAPANVAAVYNITQDNTGSVTITPNADGAVSFEIFFGDGTTAPAIVPQGESAFHVYAEGTYQVKIVAVNLTGVKTEATQQLIVSFKAPQNLVVVVENDAAISKQVNITANADFATFFEFNSGETGVTQPVVSGNIGSTISYTYQNAGTYDIMVEAKGGAIATTKYEMSFEVTEILAPIVAAPAPPSRSAADVVSIFSDAYTNVTLSELPTTWSAGGFEAINLNNDNIWKLTNLDFIGMVTNYATGIDLSVMEKMHIDYWVPEGVTNELLVKIVNTVDGGEDIESLGTTVSGTWQSIDIDMAGFDGGNLSNKEKITQILIDSDGLAGVVYIDNFYFYKAPSIPFNGITPITFEDNFTLSSFDGGAISAIDNPDASGINTSSRVFEMVKNAGQPWAGSKITLSENFDLSNPIVKAKVWSPRAGLNLLLKFEDATPWPNTKASAEITATTTSANAWEELTFDFTGIVTAIDFNNLVLIMDNGTQGDGSSNFTIYVDDITTSPVLNLEPYVGLSSFDGGAISIIDNPDTSGNNSLRVVKMVKSAGQPWAGSKITVNSPFTFVGGTGVKVKVWSPRAGLKLLLKFEDATPWPNTKASAEVTATSTIANGWEELSFSFAGITSTVDFNNLVLIMDNGTQGDGSSNYTIYLDDITQF